MTAANEFLLTGDDGSTWEVRSSKIALAGHVGHTVTATGVVSNATMHNMKEDAKDAAKDSGMAKSAEEHGHLKVTAVRWSANRASSLRLRRRMKAEQFGLRSLSDLHYLSPEEMQMPIRILIADDDPNIRLLLRRLLEKQRGLASMWRGQ